MNVDAAQALVIAIGFTAEFPVAIPLEHVTEHEDAFVFPVMNFIPGTKLPDPGNPVGYTIVYKNGHCERMLFRSGLAQRYGMFDHRPTYEIEIYDCIEGATMKVASAIGHITQKPIPASLKIVRELPDQPLVLTYDREHDFRQSLDSLTSSGALLRERTYVPLPENPPLSHPFTAQQPPAP